MYKTHKYLLTPASIAAVVDLICVPLGNPYPPAWMTTSYSMNIDARLETGSSTKFPGTRVAPRERSLSFEACFDGDDGELIDSSRRRTCNFVPADFDGWEARAERTASPSSPAPTMRRFKSWDIAKTTFTGVICNDSGSQRPMDTA